MSKLQKLQTEISKTVKKIYEGIEFFEELFEKVHSTSNPSQKEKLEADLKSEIKKLQRQRDTLRQWISMKEIKEKDELERAKEAIEEQMETYKDFERQAKTKTYSKEGLSAKSKIDPEEQVKNETREWIRQSIRQLEEQIESLEAKVLSSQSGKKKNTKDFQKKIARHQFHVENLEKILRALDNDTIEIDDIKEIQDGIAYYIDENDDPDFIEDDELYCQLDLDQLLPLGSSTNLVTSAIVKEALNEMGDNASEAETSDNASDSSPVMPRRESKTQTPPQKPKESKQTSEKSDKPPIEVPKIQTVIQTPPTLKETIHFSSQQVSSPKIDEFSQQPRAIPTLNSDSAPQEITHTALQFSQIPTAGPNIPSNLTPHLKSNDFTSILKTSSKDPIPQLQPITPQHQHLTYTQQLNLSSHINSSMQSSSPHTIVVKPPGTKPPLIPKLPPSHGISVGQSGETTTTSSHGLTPITLPQQTHSNTGILGTAVTLNRNQSSKTNLLLQSPMSFSSSSPPIPTQELLQMLELSFESKPSPIDLYIPRDCCRVTSVYSDEFSHPELFNQPLPSFLQHPSLHKITGNTTPTPSVTPSSAKPHPPRNIPNISQNPLSSFLLYDVDTLLFIFHHTRHSFESFLAGQVLESKGWRYDFEVDRWTSPSHSLADGQYAKDAPPVGQQTYFDPFTCQHIPVSSKHV
ncbi:putative CCR4-NOT transcription complex subunit 3 [Blattamonas nauphoetae]|uniref:CCR4-NOT transcription complex subunit 3 n=1 Tax=Blattamonas nauphoetae TaxID=2049346 RepID=A0ABQ9YLV6_9EUKA|nr:putative CCR4-NOT transcription complex subunit 3 [Blattamonas nauphoetae]